VRERRRMWRVPEERGGESGQKVQGGMFSSAKEGVLHCRNGAWLKGGKRRQGKRTDIPGPREKKWASSPLTEKVRE